MYDQNVVSFVYVRTKSWSGLFSMVVTCHRDAVCRITISHQSIIHLCTTLLQEHYSTSYDVQMIYFVTQGVAEIGTHRRRPEQALQKA